MTKFFNECYSKTSVHASLLINYYISLKLAIIAGLGHKISQNLLECVFKFQLVKNMAWFKRSNYCNYTVSHLYISNNQNIFPQFETIFKSWHAGSFHWETTALRISVDTISWFIQGRPTSSGLHTMAKTLHAAPTNKASKKTPFRRFLSMSWTGLKSPHLDSLLSLSLSLSLLSCS